MAEYPPSLEEMCRKAQSNLTQQFMELDSNDSLDSIYIVVPNHSNSSNVESYLIKNRVKFNSYDGNLDGISFPIYQVVNSTKKQFHQLAKSSDVYGILTLNGLPWDFFGSQGAP